MALAETAGFGIGRLFSWRRWRNRLAADPRFRAWALKTPVFRGAARRDGARIFDLMAGFVYSQTLAGLVELGCLDRLTAGDQSAEALAAAAGVPPERMRALLGAGAALGLLERRPGGGFGLGRLGAVVAGSPGLVALIRHHRSLYLDLAEPVALLRGGGETELSRFWPYVFGAEAAGDSDAAATYSALMAETQAMVAEETLRAIDLRGVRKLLDVGGGAGAFLVAASRRPGLRLALFDLPAVAPLARRRFQEARIADRAEVFEGDFRADKLPAGADAISLVRVLYDHDDATVAKLLRAAHEALPPGGRLIVSEPMAGEDAPERAGDAYFAFYCLAMGGGRPRAPGEIGAMMRDAGFGRVRRAWGTIGFVTSVVTAVKLA